MKSFRCKLNRDALLEILTPGNYSVMTEDGATPAQSSPTESGIEDFAWADWQRAGTPAHGTGNTPARTYPTTRYKEARRSRDGPLPVILSRPIRSDRSG